MNAAATEIAIQVDHLSKKFASSLRRAMAYGLHDIARMAMIPTKNRRASDFIMSTHCAQGEPLRPSEFWALHDLNFTIRKGERVGVIGPNGSGKSTLFSILSGIYGPSEGRVEVRGRLQALIALGAGFHPLLSGRENIYINASILGMRTTDIDRSLPSILQFADIGEFIDAPVKNYSSGMLVRLGFAIASHMDPDIMLIDEILAVGDARFQSKCLAFSRKLADSGCTVVMVTHNMSQVLRVCDRVIWIDRGCIVMDGEAAEVVRSYGAWAMKTSAVATGGMKSARSVVSEGIRFSYDILSEPVVDTAPVDSDREGLPVLVSGSVLRIAVDYELLVPIEGKLNIWMFIKDATTDARIFGAAGCTHGALVEARAGERGRVIFEFPDLPLRDGTYCLDIGAGDYSTHASIANMASLLESAASFAVVSSREHFNKHHPYESAYASRLPLVNWPAKLTAERSGRDEEPH